LADFRGERVRRRSDGRLPAATLAGPAHSAGLLARVPLSLLVATLTPLASALPLLTLAASLAHPLGRLHLLGVLLHGLLLRERLRHLLACVLHALRATAGRPAGVAAGRLSLALPVGLCLLLALPLSLLLTLLGRLLHGLGH